MASLETLLEQLTHKDYYDRSLAARGLGNFKDPRARKALLRALDDQDAWVVEYTLESLGRVGQAEDVATIVPYLDHSHYKIRTAAAAALGHIGGPDALAALEERREDSDSWVRSTIVNAIDTIKSGGKPAPPEETADTPPPPTAPSMLGDPMSLVTDASAAVGAQLRDLTDGTVLLRVPFKTGRAQKVRIVTGEQTSSGEGRIRLLTILGPATEKTMRWSMKQNLRISRGAIGLLKLRGKDFLALTEVVLSHEASVKSLAEAIARLARRGDRLEAMLSQDDQW